MILYLTLQCRPISQILSLYFFPLDDLLNDFLSVWFTKWIVTRHVVPLHLPYWRQLQFTTCFYPHGVVMAAWVWLLKTSSFTMKLCWFPLLWRKVYVYLDWRYCTTINLPISWSSGLKKFDNIPCFYFSNAIIYIHIIKT